MSDLSLAGYPTRVRTSKRPTAIPVAWAWGAIFVNGMAFAGPTVVPVPTRAGQLATQGALTLALMLALLANRHALIRPNVFLLCLSALAVVAAAVSIHNQFTLGSTFRAGRFLTFVAVLWLLSPWQGRSDLLLLRIHRACLSVVLVIVCLGVAIRPGLAFSVQGRLSGILWPILPTQVGHYAAVMLGITVILWMCHVIPGRGALVWTVVCSAVLVAAHTRTALLGLVTGLVCAMTSLFLSQTRVRRTFVLGGISTAVVGALFASEIQSWALRGQTIQEAGGLTGRTKVWSDVLNTQRPLVHELFGSGLSNLSWGGLPIDSTWVGTYLDEGVFGVVMVGVMLAFLLLTVLGDQRGPGRAIAVFIVVYCIFASITETGLGAPSPYLLDLMVASSMIGIRPAGAGR